jgi:hypothetical protein
MKSLAHRGCVAAVCIAAASAAAMACSGTDGAGAAEESASALGGQPDTALQRLAGELLPSAELHSGLPARAPIRLARRSREDLEAFLSAELGRQLPEARMEAIVRTYARLGLVPDTIDLGPLLRSLLLEQVVGYYDPARDTLYVVDRVADIDVEPVLVHEIVHALQDQYVDLDSLMQANLEANDRGTAAQSALEGHATFAMLEWQLEQLTGTDADLTDLPGLKGLLGDDPLAAAGIGMPVLNAIPAVIRESLLFPYLGGVVFVQEYWQSVGRVPPLGTRMPVSTEQVIHPQKFLEGSIDAPTKVRFEHGVPAGWALVYSDDLGELETRIFLREFLPERDAADGAAAGWDGDRFRLLDGPDGEVFIWGTVWDSDRDALEFEREVRRAFVERYGGDPEALGRQLRVVRGSSGRRPSVVVWDLPESAPWSDELLALGALRLDEAALPQVGEGLE